MPIQTDSGYSRPTFEEWLETAAALYQRQFGAFAPDGVNARLAEIDAMLAHSLAGFVESEAKSFMPWLATGIRAQGWGETLIGPMKAAGTATGAIRITGNDGVPVGVDQILTADNGMEYKVLAGAVSADGKVDLQVSCTQSGAAGNLDPGAVLSPVTPILGLSSQAIVLSPGLTGGTPAETLEEYRVRYLLRLREKSTGGNDTDYASWALQVNGVTRAWVRRGGMGEVLVLFMMDSTYADGMPVGDGAPAYSGDLKAVYDKLLAEAPTPALIYVRAPVARPIHYVIHGLNPATAEVKAAIEGELRDLHRRRSSPGGVWRWSWGAEAVTTAAGADSFDAIEPAASIVPAADEIPTFGSVSYV